MLDGLFCELQASSVTWIRIGLQPQPLDPDPDPEKLIRIRNTADDKLKCMECEPILALSESGGWKVGSGSVSASNKNQNPDPHQGDKSNPDPNPLQGDAYPQHWKYHFHNFLATKLFILSPFWLLPFCCMQLIVLCSAVKSLEPRMEKYVSRAVHAFQKWFLYLSMLSAS